MAEVVLVDMDDQAVGTAEKMLAHEQGFLHRAFSVFLFRGDELLLQKRARTKYHCGGLWTNTCCSHPGPEEKPIQAAKRRLIEELGIRQNSLTEAGSFVYRQVFDNGLTEFEYDHVLVGEYDGTWKENPQEVDAVCYRDLSEIKRQIAEKPEDFTPWFITALSIAERGRKGA